ncbi:MAG: helix-turn-helix transcriptional regulator [Clostridia bacterium]|nr:helix-turn-helix transcriptional regulator [Clostridia bacterium]
MTKVTANAQGIDGVHTETRVRDPNYVMAGHHCHSCYELFYVSDGECRFLINDRFQDLKAGDFILIPPMVLHYTRYVFGSCTRTVILFRRQDIPEDVQRCMPGMERFFSETSVFQVPADHMPEVQACLESLAAEERMSDVCSLPMRRCDLIRLFLMCSRTCRFHPGSLSDIQTTDQQILNAARYISEHYTQPITTKDVAQAVGFSPNYLSRKFHMSAGIGLHEYIVFVRLHHAAQELISTEDSITAIALRCGFSDSNYFKDSFKKKYGVTPRQYRKLS